MAHLSLNFFIIFLPCKKIMTVLQLRTVHSEKYNLEELCSYEIVSTSHGELHILSVKVISQ